MVAYSVIVGRIMCVQFALLLAVLATGCSENSIKAYAGLEQRVLSYYDYEKEQNWSETYKLRTPAFRKTVPLEIYLKTMKNDSKGWQLVSYKILAVREKSERIELTMRFMEKFPPSIIPPIAAPNTTHNNTSPMEVEETDTSVWEKVDGEWYCYDAATRSHLSLNTSFN